MKITGYRSLTAVHDWGRPIDIGMGDYQQLIDEALSILYDVKHRDVIGFVSITVYLDSLNLTDENEFIYSVTTCFITAPATPCRHGPDHGGIRQLCGAGHPLQCHLPQHHRYALAPAADV